MLDLNTGILALTFSEAINISTLNPNLFFIQSTPATANTNEYYQLNDSTTSNSTGAADTVQIFLGVMDLNNIKANSLIATSSRTTYLWFLQGAVYDQSGNPIVSNGNAVRVAAYIDDSTPPTLNHFTVNMGTGIITLTFSESVDVASLDPTAFLLMNTSNIGSAAFQRQLTGGTVLSGNGPVVDLQLNYNDLNFIKAETMFLTSEINSYISITSAAVQDNSGNPITPIANTAGQQAEFFITDTIAPTLLNYILDLDSNTLILTFSETVFASTLDAQGITIRSSPSTMATSSYRLTGSGRISPSISAVLRVKLLPVDANNLKQDLGLGTSIETTYLSLAANGVLDTNNNNISSIDVTNALRAMDVVPDETPPTLQSFGLDMPTTTPPVILVLEFSETVNATSLRITSIRLQDTADNSGGTQGYTLTNSTVDQVNSFMLNVTLSTFDLEAIHALPPLGRTTNTTFISFPTGTVFDTAVQASTAILPNNAKQADFIRADLIPPRLREFTLDKNLGHILLTFDENVQSSTFLPKSVTLSDGGAESLSLNTSSVLPGRSNIVTISLSSYDQNFIKNSTFLGATENTTYVSLPASTVEDIAGNGLLEVLLSQAASVIPDTTSPNITSFKINFESMKIELVFNEPINPDVLDVRYITIQNEQSPSPDFLYSLTKVGSVYTSDFSTILTFQLSIVDHIAIQSIPGLGITVTNIFIAVNPEAITDISDNMVTRISPSRALPTLTIRPVLQSFTLDLNSSILQLTFSEDVNPSSLNLSRIELHNFARMDTFMLQSSVPNTGITNIVKINISGADFNSLTARGICTLRTECYLDLQESAIFDTIGLASISSSNTTVNEFTPDTSPPSLSEFTSFDLLSGLLNLTFSESVDVSTLNTSGLILQSSFEGDAEMHRLSNLSSSNPTGPFVSVDLPESDISAIKVLPGLCTNRSNCYITADSGVIADVSGNPSWPATRGRMVTFLSGRCELYTFV